VTNVVVDVLLGLAVAAELVCCLGVVVMRTTADRLHYAGAGTTLGPLLVLAALLLREGFAAQGLQAVASVGLLFVSGPLVGTRSRAPSAGSTSGRSSRCRRRRPRDRRHARPAAGDRPRPRRARGDRGRARAEPPPACCS